MKNSENYSKNHKNTPKKQVFSINKETPSFEIILGFSSIFIVPDITKSSYLMQCDQPHPKSVFQNI
jgi:hypothetical protein